MEVREIMSRNVECISPSATLQEAASRMRTRDIGFLPVCQGDQVIGTLTDRDAMIRAIAQGMDPTKTTAKEIMSRDVFFSFEDQDIEDVAEYMSERQVRRMIILDRDKKLVGVVSLGDVAKTDGEEKVSAQALRQISEAA